MAFQAEQVQLAFFTGAAPALNAAMLWQAAFGVQAPNYATPVQGTTAASGAGASRIDLIGLPLQTGNLGFPSPVPPSIVDVKSVLQEAKTAFSKLPPRLNIVRVAAVINAFQIAQSEKDASEQIANIIPGLPYKPGDEGLIYQINSPKESSSTKNVRINRLTRWLAGNKQSFGFQVGGNTPSQPQILNSVFVAALYIDINTVQVTRVKTASVATLLDETVAEAVGVLENGYAAL